MAGFIQQSAVVGTGSGTNVTTLSSVSAGNTLISVYALNANATVVAPIDSAGQTWTLYGQAHEAGGNSITIAIAYLLNAHAGTHGLTWATQGSPSESGFSEWKGIAAAGNAAVSSSSAGATTLASGSYTPSQANEVIIAACTEFGTANPDNIHCTTVAFQSIGTTTDSAGKNCIGVEQNGSAFGAYEANAQIVTSAGAVSASWTWSNSNVAVTLIGGFKYSPGGVASQGMQIGQGPGRSPTESRFQQFRLSTVNPTTTTTLGASASSGTSASASLTGTAALSAAATSGTSSAANLSGIGILGSGAVSGTVSTANLSALGTLGAAASSGTSAVVTLTAIGTLTAAASSGTGSHADTAGSLGTLVTSASSGTSSTANLAPASSGSMTAIGSSGTASTANLSGSGGLGASASSGTSTAATLTGFGVAGAAGSSGTAAAANLGAIGVLQAAASSGTSVTADMTGSIGILGAVASSGTAAAAILLPLGSLQQITATASSGTSATADLEPTMPAPPVAASPSAALLPGVLPKTAIELERGYKYPWQATGDAIIPSPFMGSSETLQPPIEVLHVEPFEAKIDELDEATLLVLLIGAIL